MAFTSPAVGAKTVEDRSAAKHLKAVLLEQMPEKFGGHVAIQMLYLAATDALFVKMSVAVTFLAYVLKHVAVVFGVAEFPNRLLFAEVRELTVDAASSAFCVTVESKTDLVRGKLSVGMGGQERDQSRLSRGVVIFLLHRTSFEFENRSQIIAQTKGVVNSI